MNQFQYEQDQVNYLNSAFILKNCLISRDRQSGLIGQGGQGGPGGPGSPDGPGGQGCLGGQSGPGDQVCQCIWFAWSKQSNYRENLRCHACDGLTD